MFCSRIIYVLFLAIYSKDVNFEELARSTDDFNGAQCKAVCVEAVNDHQIDSYIGILGYDCTSS